MGGYGSGRYRRKKPARKTTDDFPALDVRRLKREGRIAPGQEELVAEELLGAEASSSSLRLRLAWASSGFAGAYGEGHYLRPWFVCPGCARRAAILYLLPPGGPPGEEYRLLCRLCLGLAYRSQREDELGRAKRRLAKARARLRVAPGEDLPAAKPKGMHTETFLRVGREYLEARREHAVLLNAKWAPRAERMARELRLGGRPTGRPSEDPLFFLR